VPYVVIQGIELDPNLRYLVEYVTFEYTEALPGMHVHFFFDTVPPEEAGRPADGNWYVWGGPRPFNGFRAADRPKQSAQMCALVANPDHSVQLNSGNCFVLPDVVAVTMLAEDNCHEGPAPVYPIVADVQVYDVFLVQGISADELWWNVTDPTAPDQPACWLPGQSVKVDGDISTLPLVEAPPLPEIPAGPSVAITGITLDASNRYEVMFSTQNFTPALPGTHMHFYFNTFSPEEVGITGEGKRLMYGGEPPFVGYTLADRPAGATELCVLVANPNHTVVDDSGNCFPLP
jgi:hypothetical protein